MTLRFAFILPTTDCRARCAHCFYETGATPRVEAASYVAPLAGALDALVEDGLQQVIISGGEPLLAPALPELVELCAGKLVHVLLLTGGDGLDEPTLERLAEAGVDDLTINARAADSAIRELTRRVVFHSRYTPTLLTCLTRQGVGEVPALLALAASQNLPQLFTPAYVPRAASRFAELSLHGLDEQAWAALLDALEQAGSAALGYMRLVRRFYRGEPLRPASCPMGTTGLVIDADASVHPCFHRHDLTAGNLLRDPWSEIRRRLARAGEELRSAPCFGEHCLSMFVDAQLAVVPEVRHAQ